MIGVVNIVEETIGTVKKVVFSWESASDGGDAGKASATTTLAYNGVIERLVTVPDAVAAPTADYDITILDEDGVDVLLGAGQNRHTANTQQVAAANLGIVANDKLTLNVANAGNGKKGTVYLYLR